VGPIEVLWAALLIVFIIVGIARTFPKELGVTLMLLVAMLVLVMLEPRIMSILAKGVPPVLKPASGANAEVVAFHLYAILLIFITLISYLGVTLTYEGTVPKGLQGLLMNAGAGLLNGYLFIGTIWFYLEKFHYPMQQWGLIKLPLSSFAQSLIRFLPQNIIPQPQDKILIVFIILLLILRVIR
jgi:hypothetical protein